MNHYFQDQKPQLVFLIDLISISHKHSKELMVFVREKKCIVKYVGIWHIICVATKTGFRVDNSWKITTLYHFMTCNLSTSGARTAYPSGAYEFSPPIFSGVRAAQSFAFCVVCCGSPFVLFLLDIVLSVLFRFMTSCYPFGIDIFKLFLVTIHDH